jgi:hypothetical protein
MSELKPCPFCGENNLDLRAWVRCDSIECAASGPTYSDKTIAREKWNNAFCWKEIDQQKERIRLLEETIERMAPLSKECLYVLNNHACHSCGYGGLKNDLKQMLNQAKSLLSSSSGNSGKEGNK